jgi:hypothetical protein
MVLLQFARWGGHAMLEQAPATQVLVCPCPEVQAFPGDPQFASVVTSSSQPSARSLFASAQPVSQVNAQVPVAQLGVAWAPTVHATPQAPQFVRVVVDVSQPSESVTLQLA